MYNLSDVMKKVGIESVILNGLTELAGDEKAQEVWVNLCKWTFRINFRASGRLGLCSHNKKEIQVSSILFKMEHTVKRRNTLLHEIAHAVCPMLYGKCDGHGHNWRRIMRAFGEVPQRCSTNEAVSADLLEKRKAKAKIIWACQRCEQEFPILKRRRSPAENYTHNKCGGKLYVKRDANGHAHSNPSKK